jgi:hypothetical protein
VNDRLTKADADALTEDIVAGAFLAWEFRAMMRKYSWWTNIRKADKRRPGVRRID